MRGRHVFVVILIFMVPWVVGLRAEIPHQISFQGKLAGVDGSAITDTTDVMFSIYPDSSGGSSLWTETQSVSVIDGLFQVMLGSITEMPQIVFEDGTLFLGITVYGSELSPRKPFGSAGFAFHAAYADSGAASGDNVWTVSGENIYRLNGDIGIGTANPVARLDVVETDERNNLLRLKGATDAEVRLRLEDDQGGAGQISKSNWALAGFTISNQDPGAALNLVSEEGDINLRIHPDSGATWEDNSLTKLHVDGETGNVGIGTAAPVSKVDIRGVISIADDGAWPNTSLYSSFGITRPNLAENSCYLSLVKQAIIPWGMGISLDHNFIIGLAASNPLKTIPIPYLSVTPPGNVGIGTTSPDQKLGVNGMIGIYPNSWVPPSTRGMFLYHEGNSANIYAYNYPLGVGDPIGLAGSDVTLSTYISNGSISPRLFIQSDGNVGIGTTNPVAKLDVDGTVRLRSVLTILGHPTEAYYTEFVAPYSYHDPFHIDITHGDPGVTHPLGYGLLDGNSAYGTYLGAHYAEKALVIKNNTGNVGIGTANPASKLHVSGNAYITSSAPDYEAILTVTNTGEGRGIYASTNASMNRNAAIYGDALDNGGSGVEGHTSSLGVSGGSSVGVIGLGDGTGGSIGGATLGVLGRVNSYQGSDASVPVGVYGWGASGTGNTWGVAGETNSDASGAAGVKGTLLSGAATGRAIWGETRGAGWAGYFQGNVNVTGNIYGANKYFRIDHPLDPANKYLQHCSVESPDMLDVYSGNVILNHDGEAAVELPSYFEALNKDFRYQLTCIGGYAPVYIAEKVTGNHFRITGGTPGLEVSWQITGVRQDAWANANRVVPEIEKTGDERGKYLHPKELGKPETMGIDYHESTFYGGR